MRMRHLDGMDLINGKTLERYMIKMMLGGGMSLI
jgi:hypothetical protein